MPRRSRVPSYRLHRPSGQAIVVLSGRMVYLGRFDSPESRVAYAKALAQWEAANRALPPLKRSAADQADAAELAGPTVVQLAARYWRHAESYYRKADGSTSGELFPIKSAIRILRTNFGKELVADFGPLKLQALQQAMIREGWARPTVNKQVGRIVRIFAWGVSQEIVPPAIPQALREVPALRRGRCSARETIPVRPVAEATFEATLPHLPPTVADLLRIIRLTGARPGEICGMRPADIDRSAAVWLYRPATHKNAHRGKDRVIPIGPKAQAILAPYLEGRPAEFTVFRPDESEQRRREQATANRKTPSGQGNKPGSNRKQRPNRRPGAAYSAVSLGVAIRRACEAAFGAGCESWSANQLRHSAATEIRRRFGLEAAQAVLGHSEADTTQIYAERDLAKAAEVAREIG